MSTRKKIKSKVSKIVKRKTKKSHTPVIEKQLREPVKGKYAFKEEAKKIALDTNLLITGKPHWLKDVQIKAKELEARGEFNLPEKDRWELSKLKSTLRKFNVSTKEVHEKAFN